MEVAVASTLTTGSNQVSAHVQNSVGLLGCRIHPYHRQQPGVCSCCLRERLSYLSSSATGSAFPSSFNSYNSLSSSYSFSQPIMVKNTTTIMSKTMDKKMDDVSILYSGEFSGASSCSASPKNGIRNDVMTGSVSFIDRGSSRSTTGLRKSRSIAFVPRSRVAAAVGGKKKKKNSLKKKLGGGGGSGSGSGFWSKLIRSTSKRTKEVFMQ